MRISDAQKEMQVHFEKIRSFRKFRGVGLVKIVIGILLFVNLSTVTIYAESEKNLAPQISITIDDIDMNANDTPKLTLDQRNLAILDVLRLHGNLKAALFVCGMRVDNEQGRKHLLEWDKARHIIANHSYSHFYFPSVEFDKFSQDILRGEKVISDLKHFRKLFRFPYLKEGNTLEKRDKIRSFLKENGYGMGYVTIDTSEWAIDARLRKRLNKEPNADLTNYRNFYLEHIWERAVFYDDLAKKVTGKPVKHTLLIHHNLVTALFLGDLLEMFKKKGWKLINAENAFKDPIFNRYPETVPAGESIIWALAKESGKFNDLLRYPAEDVRYENEKMDKLGL
jgi:peptidoglycan/xylan/chitin deacetylase (PgdA/CDA1 family)